MRKWVRNLLLVAVALTAGTLSARAESIELTLTSATGPVAGVTTYNYEVDLTPVNRIQSGDFFVLYDFAGLTGTPTETLTNSANWTVTVELVTTPQPVNQVVVDDPTLPNARFTYTGSSPITNYVSGSTVDLGSISLQSTIPYNPSDYITYSGQDHVSSTGPASGNTDSVEGPIPLVGSVPLPSGAAAGLVTIATCGLVVGRSKLRRSQAISI